MLALRTAGALVGALVCLCLGAAPAAATINLDAFTLTPSTTAAGSNPTIAAKVRIAPSPNGDDVRNLTVALAPGLLANPTVVPARCSQAQLEADECPAGAQIGTGLVDAHVEFFGEFVDVPARLYLLNAAAGDVARAGLVADAFGVKFVAAGPIRLRTSPSVGLDLRFENIARRAGDPEFGPQIELREIDLNLNGSAGGGAFTRNPTSCGPATSTLTAVSYAGDTKSRSSSFTPTGCSGLPFSPQVGALASLSGLGNLELATAITQRSGEAALRRAALTLPAAVAPRLSALTRACGAADPAACPASATVGSAMVTTPLLAEPLRGRIVLRKGSPLPGLALVFPAPFPLKLEGTTSLTTLGLRTTFSNLPDVPISRLDVLFSGGSDSLFTGAKLCLTGGVLRGSFTGQNGKSSSDRTNVLIGGCPFPTPTATVSLRNLAAKVPVLRLVVSVPEATAAARRPRSLGFKRITVKLPKGLKLNKRKLAKRIALRLDGKRGGASRKASSKRLKLKLERAGVTRVVVKLKGRALRVSKALRRKVRGSARKRLKFTVKVRYAGDGTFTLRPRARAR